MYKGGQAGPAPGEPEGGRLRVFISYSRDDLEFADQLVAALEVTGFDVAMDRHGITGGEDFRRRLGALIREADTVVFVLSPSSVQSGMCAWEVEEAIRLGKRIIPVVCRELEGRDPPPLLKNLDYVFFYPEPKVAGSGFGHGLARAHCRSQHGPRLDARAHAPPSARERMGRGWSPGEPYALGD